MAKDAKGHGSDARGGGSGQSAGAAEEAQNRSGVSWAKQARANFETARNKYAESRSEPAIQAHIANNQVAGALAQGHPKSAPVDVHPSMSAGIADNPAHSRLSAPGPTPRLSPGAAGLRDIHDTIMANLPKGVSMTHTVRPIRGG
jgi:hypothetical protein